MIKKTYIKFAVLRVVLVSMFFLQISCGIKSVNEIEAVDNENVNKISNSGIEEIVTKNIDNKTNSLKLKIISTGKHYEYYYSTDKNDWTVLAKNVTYLSTANSFCFTGTNIGMFAFKNLK